MDRNVAVPVGAHAGEPVDRAVRNSQAQRGRGLLGLRINTALSEEIIVGLAIVVDMAAVSLAGALAALATDGLDSAEVGRYLRASAIAALVVSAVLGYFRLYRLNDLLAPARRLRRVFLAHACAFLLLVFAVNTLDGRAPFDPRWKVLFFLASAMAVGLGRVAFSRLIDTAGRTRLLSHHIVIVGAGSQGQQLVERIDQMQRPWTRVLGFFDDRVRDPNARVSQLMGAYPVLGTTHDLVAFARRFRVDEIFIALPWAEEARILELVERLRVIPADMHIGPDLIGLRYLDSPFTIHAGVPAMNVMRKPVDGWGYVSKWLLDKTVAVAALALLSPLLLIVAAAIKLESPGPIFFRQKRYGFNSRLIEIFKFRSLYHDQCDASADRLVTRRDPRVTRVGRFIRSTSIDELPQLINVLKGSMSIVGPRPHAIKAKAGGQLYEDVVAEYAQRHRIKPGITGWAQVNGWRGETDTEEKIVKRVECDLYYIDNWSIFIDLYIIAATIVRLPFQRSAY